MPIPLSKTKRTKKVATCKFKFGMLKYLHASTYKKMIAPIIIVFLILVYYAAYTVFFIKSDVSLLFKIIGIIVTVALSAVFIWLLAERLNETLKQSVSFNDEFAERQTSHIIVCVLAHQLHGS